MRTILVTLLFIHTLISCNNHDKEKKFKTSLDTKLDVEEKTTKSFANPVFIYGSSFGHYFQTLYRNNQYETMLSFTSSRTKSKFGKQTLVEFYQNKFKFDFQLGCPSNISSQRDTITLTYTKAYQIATRRKITIQCVIENDSTKILLNELIPNPFY